MLSLPLTFHSVQLSFLSLAFGLRSPDEGVKCSIVMVLDLTDGGRVTDERSRGGGRRRQGPKDVGI